MPTSLTSTLVSILSKLIEYKLFSKTSNRSNRLPLCCFATATPVSSNMFFCKLSKALHFKRQERVCGQDRHRNLLTT